MKKWMHRGMGMVLVLLMLSSLFTFSAYADETESAPEETGFVIDKKSAIYAAFDEAAEGLSARQILVYDSTNDQVLYVKAPEGGKLYPASVTKLFTCYAALQILDPAKVVTAGNELDLVAEDSSKAYIYRNQQVTVKMLVGGMMMPSGNDAAMIMAAAAGRKLAGNSKLPAEEAVRTFVAEMNRQAKELGFEKTHFTNPDGYHVGSHYTCLNDMIRMAELALDNEIIRKYMGYYGLNLTYVSGQSNTWINTNQLMNKNGEFYCEDAIGMKTGHTSQAGHCLMSAFEIGEKTIVIGVFGCSDKNARFADSIVLRNVYKQTVGVG